MSDYTCSHCGRRTNMLATGHIRLSDGKRLCWKLPRTVSPDAAALIRTQHGAGESAKEIAQQLNERKLRTPAGEPWEASTVFWAAQELALERPSGAQSLPRVAAPVAVWSALGS